MLKRSNDDSLSVSSRYNPTEEEDDDDGDFPPAFIKNRRI